MPLTPTPMRAADPGSGHAGSAPHREAAATDSASNRSLKILIADDDIEALTGLGLCIREMGHTCFSARDGEEALMIHARERPDVIVADWEMPRMNGVELCRRIRERDSAGYTYFVFVTGYADKQHFLQGMRAGADDYLTKPIDLDELQARLCSAGRVVSLHRKLAAQNVALRRDSQSLFIVAHIDPVTQTANRRALDLELERIWTSATVAPRPVALAMMDIDHFKNFNDRYGHPAGDRALRTMAGVVRNCLRRGDLLFRYGGEEFVAVLKEPTPEQARTAMERVRAAVERTEIPVGPGGETARLTLSIGLVNFTPGARNDAVSMIRAADDALYLAKHGGRNQVCVAEAT